MTHITVLGLIAGFCTTVAFLPQVFKILQTKHTRDLSLPMYILLSLGVSLWTVYGILLRSLPVIVANVIVFFLSLYIIAMKVKYK